MNKEELIRLLQVTEIPVGSETKDGKFKSLERLNVIQKEVETSGSRYKLIAGKNNYFKLYGQASLEELADKYNKVVLVSSHADNLQMEPKFDDRGAMINGIFDNSSTNASCVYAMKYAELPENVLFAFTSNEEDDSKGAKKVAKKIEKYFNWMSIDAITLDVTLGLHNGADFTLENALLFKVNEGEEFLDKILNATEGADYKWDYIAAAPGWKKKKRKDDYVTSEDINAKMKSHGCKDCSTYGYNDPTDESLEYNDRYHNAISLCLPCSARTMTEMHSPRGFEISRDGFCNYTEFLIRILQDCKGYEPNF